MEKKKEINQKCSHIFWKNEQPPRCFNCGKTKEEITRDYYLDLSISKIQELKSSNEKK